MWKAQTVLVVVQPAPVLQWLYRRSYEKSKEQPESSMALGSPGAEYQWWPWGMSKDRNPMICLSFSTCPVPGLLRAKGREKQGISGWLKLRFYFNPAADIQRPSASPAGAAQEGSLANWGVLHMCCCLWHVCKHCILSSQQCLKSFKVFSNIGKMKAMKCHQALKFLGFFECELHWF